MSEKSEKSRKGRRKSLHLLNDFRNFNEIFRKDMAHDNIKNHKKTGFHSLPRKHKQYVLQRSSPKMLLIPFSQIKTKILKSINTKNNIFTYTHLFCTFNPKKTLKIIIQGANVYIFL